AQQHIFYAGLFGGGNRYGIAVAAEPGGKPDYVHVSDCRRLIARRWNVALLHSVPPLPGGNDKGVRFRGGVQEFPTGYLTTGFVTSALLTHSHSFAPSPSWEAVPPGVGTPQLP